MSALLAVAAAAPASAAETFETAYARAVETFCAAVAELGAAPASRAGDASEAVASEARIVLGFTRNFSLAGLSGGHRARLEAILTRAGDCRDDAAALAAIGLGGAAWDALLADLAAAIAARFAEGSSP